MERNPETPPVIYKVSSKGLVTFSCSALRLQRDDLKEHLVKRGCLWLPVKLPLGVCQRYGAQDSQMPLDVALWLVELRHTVESSDLEEDLKPDVRSEKDATTPSRRSSRDVGIGSAHAVSGGSDENECSLVITEVNLDANCEDIDDFLNDVVGYTVSEADNRLGDSKFPIVHESESHVDTGTIVNDCVDIWCLQGEGPYFPGRGRKPCGFDDPTGETQPSHAWETASESTSSSGDSAGIQEDSGFVLYKIKSLERGIYSIQEETSSLSASSASVDSGDIADDISEYDNLEVDSACLRCDNGDDAPEVAAILDGSGALQEDGDGKSGLTVTDKMAAAECDEVLNELESIIEGLEEMDPKGKGKGEVVVQSEDPEFTTLCREADCLAEESLEHHLKVQSAVPKRIIALPKPPHKSTDSEMSDEVFTLSPTADPDPPVFTDKVVGGGRRPFDINTIFDNGQSKPVPPERKRKPRTKKQEVFITLTIQGNREPIDANENNSGEVVEEIGDAGGSVANGRCPLHCSENQYEELLLLTRVTESTKEKRHFRSSSLDGEGHADTFSSLELEHFHSLPESCGNPMTGVTPEPVAEDTTAMSPKLDVSTDECYHPMVDITECLTPEAGTGTTQSPELKTLVEECYHPMTNGAAESRPPVADTTMGASPEPKALKRECCHPSINVTSESRTPTVEIGTDASPESKASTDECYHSYDSARSCDVILTKMRPISSVEFPPKEGGGPAVEPDECYWSVDSMGRSRKGSGSSDIVAWKQDLQWSGLCHLDDEWDKDCMQSDEWFSSLDDEGRVYFFEENSNESSWTLPRVDVATSESPATGASPDIPDVPTLRVQTESVEIRKRGGKSQSMIIGDSKQKDGSTKSSSMPRNKPDFDGNIGIVREGPLNRTKLLENGKKLRKNWASNHVVLTERSLLFFKDAKTLASAKASPTLAGPEFRIELPGAALLHDEKVSSRKNVFLVSSALGLEVLLQCDNNQLADEWFTSLQATIARQPAIPETGLARSSSRNTQLMLGADSPDETKKGLRIGRTKSVKVKHKEGSLEDLGSTPDERQVKIKARLKKFFNRRPTREVLVKKGIYKDEPVFGCLLVDAVGSEIPRVPYFVRRCVEAIESKPENMKMDGLYRASGNLSQVQKIRLQVDQNNLSVLETEDDVHVLAGAFKLFFRELKQPLIPFEFFQRALAASTNPNKRDKNHEFRSIIKALPGPNRDTLDFLLQHLLKVTKWQEYNRMDISNLAIVFGPTLMWPESESPNMAFFLMQQNLVIEYLLLEFVTIFR